MADAIAAKREARRRKILENAENRLKKIASIQDNKIVPESPKPVDIVFPGIAHNDGDSRHSHLSEENVLENNSDSNEADFENVANLPSSGKSFETAGNDNDNTPTNYHTLFLLLLGLCTRYFNLIIEQFELLVGIDLIFLHFDKIFTPLIAFELIQWYRKRLPKLGDQHNLNLLLKLNNLRSTQSLQMAIKGLSLIIVLLKDMSLYFFSFIIIDLVFEVFQVG